jgi:hypothetical protein
VHALINDAVGCAIHSIVVDIGGHAAAVAASYTCRGRMRLILEPDYKATREKLTPI